MNDETTPDIIALQTAHHAEMMNGLRMLYKKVQELETEITGLKTAPAASGSAEAVSSFAAETLQAEMLEGVVYWKIKGGSFTKHGVRVWPEVLTAAGFDVEALNIRKPINLAGYTAYYAAKDNGNPKKVTALEKKQ